jgi:tetratricopeptide (TPR) repeat protein
MRGIGEAHHPVSTGNGPAQQFFDQGLALVYGFNHEAAYSAFKHAAELDPALAMAWWGMALALGPNYNFPADADREKRAYEAIQRAISLQEKTSQAERAYIQALAARCSKDAKADRHQLGVDYRNAMSKLVQQYPDDLDAATLYAGSMMNLHPWQLWLHDGRPNEGTEEITEVLESVLLRDPNHLGANHYYIHAVEASPHPERGLSSAALLEKLAPAAGHLTHMPSHIYARVGDYAGAARVNANAVAADEKFLRATRDPGMEASMLYLHDLHFLAYAHCMSGNFAEAKRAADKLVAQTQPRVKEMSMLEGFLSTPLFVLMTFERWDDILKIEMPDPAHIYTTGNWHFVRGMALAGLGRVREAERESKACFATLSKLPRDARFDLFNLVTEVARVQENLLAGMIKHAERDHGEEKEEAVEGFSHAVAAEDALNYNEPPAWFPPVRPILGEILLEDGKAAAAEKIFRNALEKTPRYPRALAGLRESLKAQKRIYEAELVDQQLRGTQGKIDKVHSRRVRK